jgi:membrane-bound lytic murein transglycosylase B
MYMRKTISFVLIAALLSAAMPVMGNTAVFAQTSIESQRAALEAELRALQAEIAQKEAILREQQKQTGTIKKDVTLLTSQIETAKLKIRQKTIAINNLSQEIKAKSVAITDLQKEINREHDSLEQLVKRTNELDQKGATYVLLSAASVTDFYQDLDDFLAVKQSLYASVSKIKQIKSLTEDQKEDLEAKQAEEEDAKDAIDAQKRLVEKSEAEKRKLLNASQSKEKEYQAVLAERQKKVAEIRSKLFSLAGGTAAIPFKDAYAYAKEASTKTGVRPAFVLAILTQESNLGKNVGTCNRATDPISKKWQNIMPGPQHKASGRSSRDDQSAFLRITSALGLNPDTTPLSCPLPSGGWGGAMGPSQFIPTTWESIASRVSAALGTTASPWRPRDAIMASSIYLKDRGGIGGEANERNAACKYYSGRACDGRAPANSFYGNNVMALARGIQADIDYLEQYGVSRR